MKRALVEKCCFAAAIAVYLAAWMGFFQTHVHGVISYLRPIATD